MITCITLNNKKKILKLGINAKLGHVVDIISNHSISYQNEFRDPLSMAKIVKIAIENV
jgi:hypothetical protein